MLVSCICSLLKIEMYLTLILCQFKVCVCVYVCVLSFFSSDGLFATLWTVAHQTPLSVGFSKQEYWSGLPFPSLKDLPDPGI